MVASQHASADAALAQTDVLVVGAGPVGLALAGDLGWRGVSCAVVDRGDGNIEQPRMTNVGVRTMEFCRRWGIVPWVEGCPYPRDRRQDNVYTTSLGGYEFGREFVPSLADGEPSTQSPQSRYRCPQDMFDPILRRHALSYPSVSLRYHTELVGLQETGGGVIATVRDAATGRRWSIRAAFAVGCDGASSTVRDLLGIAMDGPGTLTYTTNVIFSCPNLDTLHDKDDAYRWVLVGPEGIWATLVAINGRDRWRFSIVGDEKPQSLGHADLDAAIRRAIGVECDFEICSVMPWVRREGVAERYRQGRVFLAGDACHVMSPTGGFGMNTGIGDAVDLSWKLEAALRGWGGTTLLDSYGIERAPVAARNARESSGNLYRMLETRRTPPPPEVWQPGAAGNEARDALGRRLIELMWREWHSIGIHLGYSYVNSPVCAEDPDTPAVDRVTEYAQTTVPGGRAPHVWLPDGRSTLDWYGRGFVLVQSGGAPDLTREIVVAASRQDVPLRVERLSDDRVAEVYERRLVLVRPDGHVAWRSDDGPGPQEAAALIERVRGITDGAATSFGPDRTEEMAV